MINDSSGIIVHVYAKGDRQTVGRGRVTAPISFTFTSIATVEADHREGSVSDHDIGAIGEAIDGARAGLSTGEFFLSWPSV